MRRIGVERSGRRRIEWKPGLREFGGKEITRLQDWGG